MNKDKTAAADVVFNSGNGALAGIQFTGPTTCYISFDPYYMTGSWAFNKDDLQEYIDWLCSIRDEHMS